MMSNELLKKRKTLKIIEIRSWKNKLLYRSMVRAYGVECATSIIVHHRHPQFHSIQNFVYYSMQISTLKLQKFTFQHLNALVFSMSSYQCLLPIEIVWFQFHIRYLSVQLEWARFTTVLFKLCNHWKFNKLYSNSFKCMIMYYEIVEEHLWDITANVGHHT